MSERDLAFARQQIEGMVESGIAPNAWEAADILLAVGEITEHMHARLLGPVAREIVYGKWLQGG